MTSSRNNQEVEFPKYISTLRKVAYAFSGLLFFLWGLFFFEHLPLFLNQGATQPTINWIIQAIHLFLLIGYLMVFKYPRVACFVIPLTSLILFAYTAGDNAVLYSLVSMIPVYILVFLWSQEKKLKRRIL